MSCINTLQPHPPEPSPPGGGEESSSSSSSCELPSSVSWALYIRKIAVSEKAITSPIIMTATHAFKICFLLTSIDSEILKTPIYFLKFNINRDILSFKIFFPCWIEAI